MSPWFADTSFWVAYLSARDVYHTLAVQLLPQCTAGIVTTDWVLVEFANFFSARQERAKAAQLCQGILERELFHVVPADRSLLADGLSLYESRADKTWSLTDCISILVMKRGSPSDALTNDHHFEQAGFRILLKELT